MGQRGELAKLPESMLDYVDVAKSILKLRDPPPSQTSSADSGEEEDELRVFFQKVATRLAQEPGAVLSWARLWQSGPGRKLKALEINGQPAGTFEVDGRKICGAKSTYILELLRDVGLGDIIFSKKGLSKDNTDRGKSEQVFPASFWGRAAGSRSTRSWSAARRAAGAGRAAAWTRGS